MRFRSEFVRRSQYYWLGVDEDTGGRVLAVPVSASAVDYSEYYALTSDQYALFVQDEDAALAFVTKCRRHERDDLLIVQPGWNRGEPYWP